MDYNFSQVYLVLKDLTANKHLRSLYLMFFVVNAAAIIPGNIGAVYLTNDVRFSL